MWAEQRLGAEVGQERTRLERSLREASRRLRARQEDLHAVTRDRLHRSQEPDIVELADAALAFEAMDTRVRFISAQLRRLRSTAEYGQQPAEPVVALTANDGSTADGPRWSGPAPDRRREPTGSSGAIADAAAGLEHVGRVQRPAESRLEERRDSLRRAAKVVRLCPDAGESADLAELAVAFERAADETLVLDDRLLSGDHGGFGAAEPPRRAS